MKTLLFAIVLFPAILQAQFSATAAFGFNGPFLVGGYVEGGYSKPIAGYESDRVYFATQVRLYEFSGVSIAPVIGYQMDFGNRIEQSLIPYIKLDNFVAGYKAESKPILGAGIRWYQYSGFFETGYQNKQLIVSVGWTMRKRHRNN